MKEASIAKKSIRRRQLMHPASCLLLLLCLCILTSAVQAEPEVTFSGQVRARLEVDNKAFDPNLTTREFIDLRTRLATTALLDDNAQVFLQLQDSRRLGAQTEDGLDQSGIRDARAADGLAVGGYRQMRPRSVDQGYALPGQQPDRAVTGLQYAVVGHVGADHVDVAFQSADRSIVVYACARIPLKVQVHAAHEFTVSTTCESVRLRQTGKPCRGVSSRGGHRSGR